MSLREFRHSVNPSETGPFGGGGSGPVFIGPFGSPESSEKPTVFKPTLADFLNNNGYLRIVKLKMLRSTLLNLPLEHLSSLYNALTRNSTSNTTDSIYISSTPDPTTNPSPPQSPTATRNSRPESIPPPETNPTQTEIFNETGIMNHLVPEVNNWPSLEAELLQVSTPLAKYFQQYKYGFVITDQAENSMMIMDVKGNLLFPKEGRGKPSLPGVWTVINSYVQDDEDKAKTVRRAENFASSVPKMIQDAEADVTTEVTDKVPVYKTIRKPLTMFASSKTFYVSTPFSASSYTGYNIIGLGLPQEFMYGNLIAFSEES
jgi:hypothetical protein